VAARLPGGNFQQRNWHGRASPGALPSQPTEGRFLRERAEAAKRPLTAILAAVSGSPPAAAPSSRRRLLRGAACRRPSRCPPALTREQQPHTGRRPPAAEITVRRRRAPPTLSCYFHGGVYVMGDGLPRRWPRLAGRPADYTRQGYPLVEYRLRPPSTRTRQRSTTPLGSLTKPSWTTARHLRTSPFAGGGPAGGGLAIATLVNAREQRAAPCHRPAALVMSPYADPHPGPGRTHGGQARTPTRLLSPGEPSRPGSSTTRRDNDPRPSASSSPVFADLSGLAAH